MAGFDIKSFKSYIGQSGVLQTNKFIVAFRSPQVLTNVRINDKSATDMENVLQLRAEQVKLPGLQIVVSDVNRYGVGPNQKMPYNASFQENSITFIADKNGDMYRYFYTWLSKIFDFSGQNTAGNGIASYRTEYKDYYTTDLHIYVFDNYGKQTFDVVMYRAFPNSLNEVNLGWSNNNDLMKITVGFSYRDWSMVNVSSTQNSQIANPSRITGVTTFGGAPTPQPTATSTSRTTVLR